MNKLIKVTVSALVLGLGTAAYATEANRGGHGGGNPGGGHQSGNSGCGTKCDGEIPIELNVPKHCDLDILGKDKKITMAAGAQNKWSGSAQFEVRANAPYKLNITKPSELTNAIDGTQKIGVNVDTKLGTTLYAGATLPYSSTARTFDVVATTVNAVSEMAHYGTYKGTYKVAVDF
ncbi:hypothetical protein [Acinetobacter sp. YH01005]|uniref:hypothetical protein n=1 Tax=Acinetobacter sp. YH01005 TaxID=2601021 RepID=UPI0015D0D689|nr:hypothetical protein [Acinetobacter sp. YH01005]